MTERLTDSLSLASKQQFTTFTPTWSGYTRGNGTSNARYYRIGRFVQVFVQEILGSTSSVSAGDVKMTLPVTPLSVGAIQPNVALLLDNGTLYYYGFVQPVTATEVNLRAIRTDRNVVYAGEVALSSTVPFTWAVQDQIQFSLGYEVAA